MRVTQVKVKLTDASGVDRLRAFCTLTFDDCFVVHDVRVIEGPRGLFVAMPSRPVATRCPRCLTKNPVRSRYCNECGAPLDRESEAASEREHGYLDIVHPINGAFRQHLEAAVLDAYNQARGSKTPTRPLPATGPGDASAEAEHGGS